MIIVDENVDFYWIKLLRKLSYELYVISEQCPGIPDKDIIKLVNKFGGILVTEDKDFGELIFANNLEKIAVIFMRYDQPNYEQVEKSLIYCLKRHYTNPSKLYFTITKNKVRIRKL